MEVIPVIWLIFTVVGIAFIERRLYQIVSALNQIRSEMRSHDSDDEEKC